MRPRGNRILATALIGAVASAMAAETEMLELRPPRPPGMGETVQVQVTAGPLPPGARVVVMSADGEVLGSIFPFGPSKASGTVPVPNELVLDGRLQLQLQIVEPGAPPRPPRPGEVEKVEIALVPGTPSKD